MLNPDQLMSNLLKLGFFALGLVVATDLVSEILRRLSFTDLILAFVGLALISPLAYLIRETGRERPPQRPRRGAERTPLLPPREEN
jgi:hypothetical protein